MTTNEAREQISKEFIDRYYTWLEDVENLPEYDYGRKYGWGKPPVEIADSVKAVTTFHKYIFDGRYISAWEKAGYPKEIIWDLYREGFLSLSEDHSWIARQTGKTMFYYITQATAKKIYRDHKAGLI